MPDINSIISESGISVGNLTLAAALRAAITLVVGIAAIKIALSLFDRGLARSARLSPLKKHLRPILKSLLGILLALMVLDSLGVQVTSFVALLSVAGLAVSLALQNTLSNIAGGIMLLTSQPYAIGDYVSIDSTEGTVDAIGLSYCKFTTVDNKMIMIPNSQIANAKITNFNRLGRRRVDIGVTASYDAPTDEVYAALHEAMDCFSQFISEREVHLSEYGESSIGYIARMWVPSSDYWTVYWGVLEAMRKTFAAHQVEMTYNHLNVHMMDR